MSIAAFTGTTGLPNWIELSVLLVPVAVMVTCSRPAPDGDVET